MAKNKGGRPKAHIDYDTLQNLCNMMCTGEECASILGVDYDTLNSHLFNNGHGGFSEYFKKHSAKAKASLRRRQYKTAMDGNVTMLIWLGKQYLEQTEKAEQYLSVDAKSLDDYYED